MDGSLSYAGIVGNGRTCALIDARGRVAWLCLPTFAQFPVFAGLLDPLRGGHLEIGLRAGGEVYWSGDYGYCEQAYVERSNVLKTTWAVAGYRVTITDAMPAGEDVLVRDILIEPGACEGPPPLRTPGALLLARLRPNQGRLPGVTIDVTPLGIDTRDDRCPASGRLACQAVIGQLLDVVEKPDEWLMFEYAFAWAPVQGTPGFHEGGPAGGLWGDARRGAIEIPVGSPGAGLTLGSGEPIGTWAGLGAGRVLLCLRYHPPGAATRNPALQPDLAADHVAQCVAADHAWLAGTARLSLPDKGLVTAYERSLLALHLLTYEPTGAILAAPTASFPSEPGGTRNWDYRFCWVRDGCYTAQALARAGALAEARALYLFLLQREENGQWPSPLWPIEPGYATTEEKVEGLCGPGGEQPVRIGNGAALQDQHDSPGNVLSGIYQYVLVSGDTGLAAYHWDNLARAADWCCEHWAEAESGIWEKRDRLRSWVHGRAMCWAGLRDAGRVARMLRKAVPARWERAAAQIERDLVDASWSEEAGLIGRACESPAVCDSSVLALLLEGLVGPEDPRMRRTVGTLERSLAHRGSYRRDEENRRAPFGLTALWMARALLATGDYARAYAALSTVVDSSTDLGLLAEYFDPVTGRQWGNFPQAFSHEELIKAITEMLWEWDGERLLLFPGVPPAWLVPGAIVRAENVPIAGRRIGLSLRVEEDAYQFAITGTEGLQVRVPARYYDNRRRVEGP